MALVDGETGKTDQRKTIVWEKVLLVRRMGFQLVWLDSIPISNVTKDEF